MRETAKAISARHFDCIARLGRGRYSATQHFDIRFGRGQTIIYGRGLDAAADRGPLWSNVVGCRLDNAARRRPPSAGTKRHKV